MLEEVQANLHLLPKESWERILEAAQEVVKQSKQRRIKAEIQQILDEQKWLEAESLTSSEDEETIFMEATTIQEAEEPETATDAWLTSEDSAPIMLHATLH